MYRCPVPNCQNEYIHELTNVHCQQYHGISKKEVIEKYGKPKSEKKIPITGSNNSSTYVHGDRYGVLGGKRYKINYHKKS